MRQLERLHRERARKSAAVSKQHARAAAKAAQLIAQTRKRKIVPNRG